MTDIDAFMPNGLLLDDDALSTKEPADLAADFVANGLLVDFMPATTSDHIGSEGHDGLTAPDEPIVDTFESTGLLDDDAVHDSPTAREEAGVVDTFESTGLLDDDVAETNDASGDRDDAFISPKLPQEEPTSEAFESTGLLDDVFAETVNGDHHGDVLLVPKPTREEPTMETFESTGLLDDDTVEETVDDMIDSQLDEGEQPA